MAVGLVAVGPVGPHLRGGRSLQMSRAKALVKFPGSGAAQEAAPKENWILNRFKQGVGLLPRFVSEAS
jgi:hypothetical protein